MVQQVKILKKDEVFKKYIFRIDEVLLQFERYNGELSEPVTRLNLQRGDSVAALVHDVSAKSFILTEQFRYSAYHKDETQGWLTELPAGMIDEGETPEAAIRRELLEEIGYQVQHLQPVSHFFPSPGACDERIFIFYAQVKPVHAVTEGGGVDDEGEDIRRVHLPVKSALDQLKSATFTDAKTIIALQWFSANRKKLMRKTRRQDA